METDIDLLLTYKSADALLLCVGQVLVITQVFKRRLWIVQSWIEVIVWDKTSWHEYYSLHAQKTITGQSYACSKRSHKIGVTLQQIDSFLNLIVAERSLRLVIVKPKKKPSSESCCCPDWPELILVNDKQIIPNTLTSTFVTARWEKHDIYKQNVLISTMIALLINQLWGREDATARCIWVSNDNIHLEWTSHHWVMRG